MDDGKRDAVQYERQRGDLQSLLPTRGDTAREQDTGSGKLRRFIGRAARHRNPAACASTRRSALMFRAPPAVVSPTWWRTPIDEWSLQAPGRFDEIALSNFYDYVVCTNCYDSGAE